MKMDSQDAELIKLLNTALRLEYGITVHMPKIIHRLEDTGLQALAQKLSDDSVRHADTVAGIINDLGGDPEWAFEPDPADKDLKTIFRDQYDKEIFAVKAYTECVNMTKDQSMKDIFNRIVSDEKEHADMVNRILAGLE